MVRAFRRETWLELAYLLLGGLTSWIAFAVLLAGGIVGGILGLTIVGLPVLVAALALEREVARLERRRTAILTGPVPELYRAIPAKGWVARLRAYGGDVQTWKDLLWLVLLMPLGYDYDLSKRTDLYAVMLDDKVQSKARGSGMAVGIRHRF